MINLIQKIFSKPKAKKKEGRRLQLKVKELTQENFREYGVVIDIPESEPTAVLKGLRCWHHIDWLRTPGEIDIGLLQIEKQDMIFKQIERHFKSHEMFSPIPVSYTHLSKRLPWKDWDFQQASAEPDQ